MRRILLSLLVIAAVAGATINLSSAFFSDTETSSGNSFTAGTIDLKINDLDNPPAVVNFDDLKPGDQHIVPKTLRVIDNNAFVWMHIKDVVTAQGTSTEPEDLEENGTPKHDLNNYMTYTLNVGGNQIINAPVNFNDAVSCWIPLGEVPGDELINMSQVFNFDPTVTNWAQGDTMTFTEEFYAEQSANNPFPVGPTSLTGRVWSQTEGKCVDSLELVDTLAVPSTSNATVLSNITTEVGKNYVIEVSGKYIFWPSCGIASEYYDPDFPGQCVADAEFALRPASSYGPGWVKGEDDYPSIVGLDLQVNGVNIDWSATVNLTDHTYSTNVIGDGNKIGFSIYDSTYTDNSGSLNVKIYKVN